MFDLEVTSTKSAQTKVTTHQKELIQQSFLINMILKIPEKFISENYENCTKKHTFDNLLNN